MVNRLAEATSPYLLQHAQNPVDWWPWGSPAFEHARMRNVPVLLSVGYSACHWCHVMAHESFEDQEVAATLNRDYVPIKVDREERPDVDAVYMQATTAMTGHGGWPMTCILTPDGEPFWSGTYLPQTQFLSLLGAAHQAWRDREPEIRAGAAHILATVSQAAERAESVGVIDASVCAAAVDALAGEFDSTYGGFGGAPKFPPTMVLSFLLRHSARTGDPRADEMARVTLRSMARSGMYDQIGSGFARYAVDRAWVVPHFEKMLYDNALLLRTYVDLARATGGPAPERKEQDVEDHQLASRIVDECVQWLLREMWTEQAGFAASLDADTSGVEGATYVWTRAQLMQVLGDDDGLRAAELLHVSPEGTFEHGTSTLQLPQDPDDAQWYADVRERLAVCRALRAQPSRDDTVVTAWNGWLIAALAEAGWYFEHPDWVDVAARCADLLLTRHVVDGQLRRSSRDGVVGAALGVAEDYGALVEGLVALYAATGEHRWLEAAGPLLHVALQQFGTVDPAQASPDSLPLTDNAAHVSDLLVRPRSRTDNAEPCGQSALAGAFVHYGALAASAAYLDFGAAALTPMSAIAAQAARFGGWALSVAEDLIAGPAVLAISHADGALAPTARRAPVGTVVLMSGPMSTPDAGAREHATGLVERPALGGRDTAYLCCGTVCQPPVTDPETLRAMLTPR